MNIKSRFIKNLQSQYPSWNSPEQNITLNNMISDQLLSEKVLELPKSVYSEISNEIAQYHQLRQWGSVQLKSLYEQTGLVESKNEGACNSFDFHINEEGKLKLIEINTNASFLALGLELYKTHQISVDPTNSFSEKNLIEMFEEESKLNNQNLDKIFILDEKPDQQRLYIEFLLYQKMFEKHGHKAEIIDINELNKLDKTSFIYNRYTDFYLSSPQSDKLRNIYNNQQAILSPSPYEYFLLADKQRMLDWQKQTDVPTPQSLLKIYDLGVADKDTVWAERKQLFFKPKNSFGSKQAFKGASISRRLFDELYGPNMIAQEYATPSEVSVEVYNEELKATEMKKMKCDLRCYAYRGKLQMVIARLYQGQTTNLQTIGGGFAVIKWI